jgi:hypothetical protein
MLVQPVHGDGELLHRVAGYAAPIQVITMLDLQDQAQRMLICPGLFRRHRIETFTGNSSAL